MSPTDPPGSPVKAQSKLFVRSEVMSVIHHLLANADLSKQERAKQIKRIRAIEAQDVVQDILIKELSRSPSGDTLHIIVELLMEIGHITFSVINSGTSSGIPTPQMKLKTLPTLFFVI